jgi:regulator of protease activity HflC (stomatin/prohibitin superfamily)
MMITGDGNLVDLLVSVRFRVTEPRVFLFEVKNGEEVIRSATEAALRTMVAGRPFSQLLTVERAEFRAEALRRVKAACDRYGTHGLGVDFDSLAIVDLHPPSEVVDAYYDVARKMEWRDQKINTAQADKTRKIRSAAAEANKIVTQARTDALAKTRLAEGDRDRYLALQQARDTLDFGQEWLLGTQAVDALLAGRPPEQVEKDWKLKRDTQIAQQKALADFRLFWETTGNALSGRNLVLIDADNVKGQRQLMLFDPDLFRMPIPIFRPPPKGPGED